MSAHQYDEGHTVAGWIGFGIAIVGTAVAGVGMCVGSGWVLWGGIGVVAFSVLVGWGLHLAGWGKPSGPRPREQWGMRVRDLSVREGHPGCVGCRLAGRRPKQALGVEVVPAPSSVLLAEEGSAEVVG